MGVVDHEEQKDMQLFKPPEPESENIIIQNWIGDINKPVVSIVCHTYNHESYITDALNSFLMQRVDFPYEIIVHDDASCDRTQKIIAEYSNNYPLIIKPILQEENQFKKGLRPILSSLPKAKGKYIAFCEGDDYWVDPDKLLIQKEFLDNNKDYVLCYTDMRAFNNNKIVTAEYPGITKDLSSNELKKAPSIYTLTTLFRNVIKDVPYQFYCVGYGDLTLWSQLGEYGKGKYLAEIQPSMYRVHSEGMHSMQTQVRKQKMRMETFAALYSYYSRKGDEETSKYYIFDVVIIAFKVYGPDLIHELLSRSVSSYIRKVKSKIKLL
jgi:glycosyltransferase involved in cell wall biosynthesis